MPPLPMTQRISYSSSRSGKCFSKRKLAVAVTAATSHSPASFRLTAGEQWNVTFVSEAMSTGGGVFSSKSFL